MPPPAPAICPACGTTVPADAPAGLCVTCVFRQMADWPDASGADPAPDGPGWPREFGDFELLGEIARGGAGEIGRASCRERV